MQNKKETIPGDAPLPSNRWQLLKDTLRYHFFDFVLASLLTLLFHLPLFGWVIVSNLMNFLEEGNLLSVVLTYGVMALCLMLGGLGAAGSFHFFKKRAWGEGASLAEDFFEGIRKNGARFLLYFFLIGLLYLTLKLDIAALAINEAIVPTVKIIFAAVSYGIFYCFVVVILFALPQEIIYQDRATKFLGNGVRFLFGSALKNIPIFIAFLLPYFVYEFVPYLLGTFIAIGLLGLFYFGFSHFFLTLYSHSLFDRSINKKRFPEIIRKGLSK